VDLLDSGFVVLQTVFLMALTWFIRLLIKLSGDLKGIERRVQKLEQLQAVDESRWEGLNKRLDKFEDKLDSIILEMRI